MNCAIRGRDVTEADGEARAENVWRNGEGKVPSRTERSSEV